MPPPPSSLCVFLKKNVYIRSGFRLYLSEVLKFKLDHLKFFCGEFCCYLKFFFIIFVCVSHVDVRDKLWESLAPSTMWGLGKELRFRVGGKGLYFLSFLAGPTFVLR